MDILAPRARGAPHRDLIRFVADRPGHDFRYAVDFSKLNAEFGWTPTHSFEHSLLATVQWYLDNRAWWEPLLAKHEADIRRGLARKSA
jgi:dTDP-glucose 4,6-dehydratase